MVIKDEFDLEKVQIFNTTLVCVFVVTVLALMCVSLVFYLAMFLISLIMLVGVKKVRFCNTFVFFS